MRAELWWLPVGAGGHVAVHTSRWWERYRAWLEHREPQQLFHSVLEVFVGERRYLIEMTPVWGQPRGDRGVVSVGPVGLRALGCCRFFRYEIRRWEGGVLSHRGHATHETHSLILDARTAETVLASVSRVPLLTWGRRVWPGGDMWNSNSVISWLLTEAGIDAMVLQPPAGGRAPGWVAGAARATQP